MKKYRILCPAAVVLLLAICGENDDKIYEYFSSLVYPSKLVSVSYSDMGKTYSLEGSKIIMESGQ